MEKIAAVNESVAVGDAPDTMRKPDNREVKRAIIGVYDKNALSDFARGLMQCGVELYATDGTRAALQTAGIDSHSVVDLTGMPEMLNGRVKTLHPGIHAGILARRDRSDHMDQLKQRQFVPIDLVCVSLYPFVETVARGASREETIENIDIGGPTMIRAAAKNSASVTVVVSPSQYDVVLQSLREHGEVVPELRQRLAAEAFQHVAAYDCAVASYLTAVDGTSVPREFTVGGSQIAELRYGENPHQQGALYSIPGVPSGVAHARHVQGPDMSFTNWLDSDVAWRLAESFPLPAAAIIKHTNPCGFGVAESALEAYKHAYQCDPRSAFGGVVALNRPLGKETAEEICRTFIEVLVVPSVDDAAAAVLATKERMRVLVVDAPSRTQQYDVRSIDGGLLVQTRDEVGVDRQSMTVMTRRAPTEDEWQQLMIAWRMCPHVKSNTIVIVRDDMAVGVGAGQMSRVEAAELAIARAGDRCIGAVAASDAFFPMPDGVETLARAGVRVIIQPAGSKKDGEVIAAADAADIAMVATGERHFRH